MIMDVQEEIQMLTRQMNGRYLRWETLTRNLREAGFPYELVQEFSYREGRRMVNLYSWHGSWGEGAVYVQETEAGRYALPGVRCACNRLLAVLSQFGGNK